MGICTIWSSQYADRGFDALQSSQNNTWACPLQCLTMSPWATPADKLQAFLTIASYQWQASCLIFCPIRGAIKNHLRLYKRLQRLLQNFLWHRWDEKVFGFPEEVTKGSSPHVLYSLGCYINIFETFKRSSMFPCFQWHLTNCYQAKKCEIFLCLSQTRLS